MDVRNGQLHSNSVIKSGWLQKTGGSGRKWSKRYFSLTRTMLYYFKNPQDKTPAGQIVIDQIIGVAEEEDDKKGRAIFTVRIPERTYYIAADYAIQRKAWIESLRSVLPEKQMEEWKDKFTILKQSWLEKEGGSNKARKRRWVTLSNDAINYYKNDDDTKPAGTIPIRSIQSVSPSEKYRGNGFEVRVVGRVYVFVAEALPLRTQWIDAITNLLPAARLKTFGVPLYDSVARRPSPDGTLPEVVSQCLACLNEDAFRIEGFLRLSGSAVDIAKYKEAFNSGNPVNLSLCRDPHTIAGLLKLYLRELPEPPIPFELYDTFLSLRFIKDPKYRVRVARALIRELPLENRYLLRALFPFMGRVASFEEINRMSPANVAIVFGPNLLRADSPDPVAQLADSQYIIEIITQLIPNNASLFKRSRNPAVALAKALHDFDARTDREVTIRANSRAPIIIHNIQPDAEGWYEGEYEGKTGFIPTTHVEIFLSFIEDEDEEEADGATAPAATSATTSTASSPVASTTTVAPADTAAATATTATAAAAVTPQTQTQTQPQQAAPAQPAKPVLPVQPPKPQPVARPHARSEGAPPAKPPVAARPPSMNGSAPPLAQKPSRTPVESRVANLENALEQERVARQNLEAELQNERAARLALEQRLAALEARFQ